MQAGLARWEKLFRHYGYPKTGEVVRCRKTGDLWRVMEREVWQRIEADPLTGESLIVPCCYFSFWRLQDGLPPRVGEMLGYLCRGRDDFAADWEVVSAANALPTAAAARPAAARRKDAKALFFPDLSK